MRHLATAGIVFTLLLGTATTARAAGDDVVLLVNGGRVRGTVLQEDPAVGVRVRLADGTIRNLPSKEVKQVQYADAPAPVEVPAAPAASVGPVAPPMLGVGSIHIETAAPGTVLVDGGVVGKAPADVKAAAVGRHRVHVDFDEGGSQEKVVLVQGGETAKVMLDVPEMHQIFAIHQGLHFGFAGEITVIPAIAGGVTFGGGGAFVVDYGASPGVDLRATAFLDVTGGPFAFFPVGGSLGARFNLGPTYTMGLAFRGGVGIIAGTNGSTPGPFLGPEVSVVGFRFGTQRQYSVELSQRVGFYFFSGGLGALPGFEGSGQGSVTFENAISFTYLFIGPPTAATATSSQESAP